MADKNRKQKTHGNSTWWRECHNGNSLTAVQRLEQLWHKHNGEWEAVMKAALSDPELGTRSYDGIANKLKREGHDRGNKSSSFHWVTKMKLEDPKKFNALVADLNSGMKVAEVGKKYGLTENQLHNIHRSPHIEFHHASRGVVDPILRRLLAEGALTDPQKGVSYVLKELKQQLASGARGLTKKNLWPRIEKIIWTAQAREALKVIVGKGQDIRLFTKHHPHIPEFMVRRYAKTLTGASHVHQPATFLKGMGRIGDIENLDDSFELPKSSCAKPIVLDANVRQFTVVNGANIGLRHKRVIVENPVRRALADANRRGDDAVIIVNPFDIDARKADGGLRVLRSQASGLNTNLDILDKGYREWLEIESKDRPQIIYETIAERFLNMLSGWAKIAVRPSGEPEFTKKVYIILGYKEEEIIADATAWELSYWTKLRQLEIEAEIKSVKSALSYAIKDGATNSIEAYRKTLAELEALRSRHIVSNIGTEEMQRYQRKVMHFVVQKLEASIPNSKVIGQGTTYVNLGGETIELNVPSHLRISESLLADYCRTYGGRSVQQIAARTVVICHPYAINYRMTDREININNARAEARVFVAPIAVDGKFLREALKDSVRSAHPISKVVFSTQFEAGVLRLHLQHGMVNAEALPVEALSTDSKKKLIRPYADTKYIWIMVATDPHFGSRNREEVWSNRCKGSLGVSDAVIEMMRVAGLFKSGKFPVHLYTVNDDPTQGNHFETHKQPHPLQMSYQDIEKRLMNANSIEEVRRMALEQFRLRGSDWLQEQMIQVEERHIKPNLDFFETVLASFERTGLQIIPSSQIHGADYDARDMGVINWGTGNHFEATVDRVMTEGIIYAKFLRGLLSGTSRWRDRDELLNKFVAAPLEGNQYFAWGWLKAPGGYEWAIEMRSDPPRLSSWADPLKGTVSNDAQRGDYGLFFTGHKTVKIYGDKHFFAAVKTGQAFYHLCASGTSTDLYGHRGFPPNNTGVSFVGIPADGPEAGPILLRPLHVEHIRRYFQKPYQFDWESFLPNPL